MAVDEMMYRRLYPEWTGGTGPLSEWFVLLIILILVPFLFYILREKIQNQISMILGRIRHKNNSG